MKDDDLNLKDLKLVVKGTSRGIGQEEVSLTKVGITLGDSFKKNCSGFYGLEIYYNEKKKILALKPSNDESKAYILNKNLRHVTLGKLNRLYSKLPRGLFEAKYNEELKMIVIYLK